MKWTHSDDLPAACRRLQLPPEAEAMVREENEQEPQRLELPADGLRATRERLDGIRLGRGVIGD